ncbi:hypothetical protein [Pelagibius sp. Alg239-R121]|uniref:hypothetical protein n=1 Tax=Pelagibius sp. Alg239-R121 TaxID=2993448 RepID=UPI0024A633F1|nr:hypothetical protein [Pelagibius sp. Alg239-R121]
MSDRDLKSNQRQDAAVVEGDRALRFAIIGFFSLIAIAASAFVAFPSLGAVFLDSYNQQYQARVTEAVICRFP